MRGNVAQQTTATASLLVEREDASPVLRAAATRQPGGVEHLASVPHFPARPTLRRLHVPRRPGYVPANCVLTPSGWLPSIARWRGAHPWCSITGGRTATPAIAAVDDGHGGARRATPRGRRSPHQDRDIASQSWKSGRPVSPRGVHDQAHVRGATFTSARRAARILAVMTFASARGSTEYQMPEPGAGGATRSARTPATPAQATYHAAERRPHCCAAPRARPAARLSPWPGESTCLDRPDVAHSCRWTPEGKSLSGQATQRRRPGGSRRRRPAHRGRHEALR